jgi:RNA polymerase sigma factor (TIGR02999 family)
MGPFLSWLVQELLTTNTARLREKSPHRFEIIFLEQVSVPMDHPEVPGDITALLHRWGEGDRQALAALATLAYDDLRNIAAGYLRREGRAQTLQATSLVNELYLRLARQRGVQLTDRRHFYAFAALMLRRILTDHARLAHSQKRPTGQAEKVPLHEDMAWVDASGEGMLDLDRALTELEALDERKVRVIELRYFLGCTNDEAAELLGVAPATVDRDLQFARTWLYRRLCGGGTAASRAVQGDRPTR